MFVLVSGMDSQTRVRDCFGVTRKGCGSMSVQLEALAGLFGLRRCRRHAARVNRFRAQQYPVAGIFARPHSVVGPNYLARITK